jgi:Putative zincin peptidase
MNYNLIELENYKKRDLSISIWLANFYAIVIIFPITAALFFMYSLVWGMPRINIKYSYFLILLLGTFLHELIHALTAARYSKEGMKSIKLGISWKFLTPYCHCEEPLKLKNYRLVLLSPFYLLGVLPAIVGFSLGETNIFNFGLLFILAAGGDLIIFWKLRNEHKDSLVLDYPDKCGCLIFDKEKY